MSRTWHAMSLRAPAALLLGVVLGWGLRSCGGDSPSSGAAEEAVAVYDSTLAVEVERWRRRPRRRQCGRSRWRWRSDGGRRRPRRDGRRGWQRDSGWTNSMRCVMSSMRWSRTAWALSLALCCAGGWIVVDPASAQSADSLAVRHVPGADAYTVPQVLVADYVVCAAEAEVLRVAEAEAARVIAAQESLVRVLRERSEAARAEASACERALGLSAGRVRALSAEAEVWRVAARSAERKARGWRTVALVASGVGVLAVVFR